MEYKCKNCNGLGYKKGNKCKQCSGISSKTGMISVATKFDKLERRIRQLETIIEELSEKISDLSKAARYQKSYYPGPIGPGSTFSYKNAFDCDCPGHLPKIEKPMECMVLECLNTAEENSIYCDLHRSREERGCGSV